MSEFMKVDPVRREARRYTGLIMQAFDKFNPENKTEQAMIIQAVLEGKDQCLLRTNFAKIFKEKETR